VSGLRQIVWVAVASVLAACGSSPKPPATVGSLGPEPVVVEEPAVIDYGAERAVIAYEAFLSSAGEVPMRPEAMRRLADLKRGLSEERLHGDPAAPPDPEHERAARAEYILLYESLAKSYPDAPQSDQVLYQLARAYEDDGRRSDALTTLDRLVGDRAGSELAAEAQFRRGEILFVDRRYGEAVDAYAAVVGLGEASPYLEHAQYKLGWSYFKLNEYDRALDAFTGLMDYRLGPGKDEWESLSRPDQERIDDTLRAMSLSFIYQEGTASAERYYASRGARPYEDLVIARLGGIYLEKEQYTDAADAFDMFVRRNPFHREAPQFDARVIEAYEKGGFGELVLEGKVAFVDRYRLDGPYWERYDPAARPEVTGLLKSNLSDLARHYHASAQRTKKREDYIQAERWYRGYVRSFPADETTPGMNFMLAEILFEQQRYAEAVSEYERTAYDYPSHEKSEEAAHAALLAYAQALPGLAPEGRLPWERRSIESALRFQSVYPAHPQAPVVLTKAAEDLFRLGDHARANVAAKRLLTEYPAAEAGLERTAWTVAGHSAFELAEYREAEDAYRQVLTLTPAQDADRESLTERLAASIYKQGEQARAAGDLRLAASTFMRVGAAAPNAGIRPTAEYDAAAALLSLEAWGEAAQVLEGFRSRYPNHELAPEATRRLAAAYMRDGQPLNAAIEFERMGRASGTPQMQAEALLQSAELFRTAGSTDAESRVLSDYVNRFPRPVEPAIEAQHRLAQLSRERGDTSGYYSRLRTLVAADQSAGLERTDRTRFLAAGALVELAAPKAAAYREVRLVEPIRDNLRRKKERMEAAIDAYGQAADYGVAEVVTHATFEIANLYYDFSRALIESDRPRDLNAEELEQYEILLEEQAFPFEEQAIEVHEVNLTRIPQGLFDEWVEKSLEQLEKLVPARYRKPEQSADVVTSLL
jgi:TolA-binding protein